MNVAVLLLTLTWGAGPAQALPTTRSPSQLSTAQAQTVPIEFARRIAGQPGTAVKLFPGSLPPGVMPVPLPPAARLVGSVQRLEQGSDQAVTSYYSVPGTLAAVRQTLRQRLASAGWKEFTQPRHGPANEGGFQGSSSGPAGFLNVYQLTQSRALVIFLDQAQPVKQSGQQPRQQSGEVELTFNLTTPPNLAAQVRQRSTGDMFTVLPNLLPPDGVEVQMQGGGSSGMDVSQSARLLSPTLDASGLLKHYAASLQVAGWKPLNSVRQGDVAQTTFTVVEKGLTSLGTLTIARTAPGEYKGLLGLTSLR